MRLNIPKLRNVVSWVLDQQVLADGGRTSRWNQGTWFEQQREIHGAIADRDNPICETGMCVAGKAAWKAGWKPVCKVGWTDGGYRDADMATKDGDTQTFRVIAANELGLTEMQAFRLFDGENSAYKIEELADEFIEEAELIALVSRGARL